MKQEGKRFLKNGMNQKAKYLTDKMSSGKRLPKEFYFRDVLDVAPELLGKDLVIKLADGTFGRFKVSEVEAYRGIEDKACHASKGRTARTEIMFHQGGKLYVYLVYGMYWMLNVVTGQADNPQAVLIRGVENFSGPGKLTRSLGIDGTFYGEDLDISDRIWFEDTGVIPDYETGPRIGINYAGEYWGNRPWRYCL
jgi:DNA-3-methyladenine glycosylase